MTKLNHVTPLVTRGGKEIPVQIENICPDFFSFWQQAKIRPQSEQKELWSRLYESRHPDVFDVYYSLYGTRDALEAALEQFGHSIGSLYALEPIVEQSIARTAPRCQDLFSLPESELRFVMMVGLFCSDAWAAFLRGEPTSFVALERLSDMPNIDVTIAHEAAHTLHRQCTGFVADVTTHTVGQTLFTEGLAILASSKAVPVARFTDLFLVTDEAWLHACKRQWPELRRSLLRDMESLAWVKPTPYFYNDPGLRTHEILVNRTGYFVGYHVVRALSEQYAFEEMARWSIGTAATEVQRALEHMPEYPSHYL